MKGNGGGAGVGMERLPNFNAALTPISFPNGTVVNNLPAAMQGDMVDPWVRKILREGNGNDSSILAWEIT